MARYLLTRAWQSALTLLLSTVVVFVGVRALPGDPALALAGEDRSPEALEAIRRHYGLDQPLPVQFAQYVERMAQGDFGVSIRTGTPVSSMLTTALPVTVELSVLAILIASALGVGAGVLAAVRRGRPAEWLANGLALIGLSVPHFWLGLLAILYLSVATGLFPASGFVPILEDPVDNLHHIVLPAVILGTGLAAIIMRQTRSAMLDSLSSDYVRTAKAKGLRPRAVITRHALRNSLIVVVTVVGLQLGGLISGAVVTEQIFGLPGFGKMTIDAVFQRDYPVIQAVVLLTATAYIVINFLVDLLYSVIDPRIRVTGDPA
ncbi:ABC transporter permease [Micromonospora taraxaci]|uniref:Peptide/nickel transport system permease protein n=1 Tax=Micromonospora taraxaci TaxID=1316803 RepID=A0A561W156_9ACTN|nr:MULTISPECIES: ABC transporter permease [Micromonospora]MCZ7374867.1 ABC transporter permease [Micromonospora sp. WMMC250]MDG4839824.1 ABC transporter permease [Micromonospora sp. WMMD967]TWG17589.1 peptide/nickel transport system permease protein [Micromonospora taraxaci]WFE53660.1 ABC transporter permease [Micromonospora sp. WMMD1155]WFE99815.1 ABC transporter permease [Micromonospora sp. WMMD964]